MIDTTFFAQVESLKDAAPVESQTLDSAILGEQFYFWTVVLMWLIHAGFMTYEAGVARRKNVMATAMKNILTIAAVTPTFYYFGWWIYNCNQPGLPIGPNSSDFTAAACQGGIPWSDAFGPNLTNNINLIFFLAFLLFSWTTASIMSGALLERVRLSAYLVLAAILGSVVWILDAAWGWSAGGWMTLRFGFHDSIASGVVHGVAGAFTLGVLFHLGPRIGKYTKEGLVRRFRPNNLHITLLGLMLIFTGFYAFYGACLVIASTSFPGWATIYLSPTTLGSITHGHHLRLRGRLHRRVLRQQGRPVLDGLRRPRGRDRGVRGGRRVRPGARLPARDGHGGARRLRRAPGSRRRCAWTTWSARWRCTAFSGLPRRLLGGRVRGRIPDRREQRGLEHLGPAARHRDLPAARVPVRLRSAWVLKKLNLLRVPPEVEIAGLDTAEYEPDIYLPEVGRGAGDARGARRDARADAESGDRREARDLVTR